MAYNENNRNRNRNGESSRNFDDNQKYQDHFTENGNQDRNYRSNDDGLGSDDYDKNRNYRGNDRGYNENRFENDRMNLDNDSSYNRGKYGNSTGVNSGRYNNSNWGNDNWNREESRNRGNESNSHYNNGNRNQNRDGDRNWMDKATDEVSSWFGDDEAARRRKMDEVKGEHKGKGPKNYKRTDERVTEDVNDRLYNDSHIDASNIEVSVDNGDVTLTGTVGSRWEKRRAEDCAEDVSGVKNVENRLRVLTGNSSGTGNNLGSETVKAGEYGSSGAAPVGAFDTSKP